VYGGPTESEDRRQFLEDYDRIKSLEAKGVGFASIRDIALTLDEKWRNRNSEYHARLLLQVLQLLTSGMIDDSERPDLVRKLALSALDKPDDIPLPLELEVACKLLFAPPRVFVPSGSTRVVTNDYMFAEQRNTSAKCLLHGWRRLDAEYDPNWRSNLPPVGISSAPSSLRDARARAEYEATQRRKEQIIKEQSEQSEMEIWCTRYPKFVSEYLIDVYSDPPKNKDEAELEALLDEYRIGAEAKKQIITSIEERSSGKKSVPGVPPLGVAR
jgi:hypothetical protein